MFRYVVRCNKNGQVLYVANDDMLELTPIKALAQQFLLREAAIQVANQVTSNKRLGVKKAHAEKIAPGKEVPFYANLQSH